jgi:hypothetical protein
MPYASPAPLAKKLNLKPGMRLVVLNAPEGFLDELAWLPQGAEVTDVLDADQAPADAVLLFAVSQAELGRFVPEVLSALPYDGLLWIAYPKRKSSIPSDLSRDQGWGTLEEAGLQPVASIAIDPTWSAVRFRPKDVVRARADRRREAIASTTVAETGQSGDAHS